MPIVEHEGASVAYVRDGRGPAVVLVHGTGGDGTSTYKGLDRRLREHWTVIRPDYSGSGVTKDDGRSLELEDLASQVLAAATDAGAERFHLLGHSLGASVCVQLAASAPERVQSLTLVAGFADADPRLRLQMELWRELVDHDRKAMSRLLLLSGMHPDRLASMSSRAVELAVNAVFHQTKWAGMARQIELDLRADVTDALAKVRAPTLVVGCSQDFIAPPSNSRALATAISEARYVELDAGHFVTSEDPDGLAALAQEHWRAHPIP